MEQKEVKIVNFTATKFGYFKALELDFGKFKQGLIAIKGNAGAGKSTIQNGLKTNIQGRKTLFDQEQYGDEWEIETQLIDGEHNIFIGASKSKGRSIEYKLFEKDLEGKKVMTPVIDGLKATPAKYMDLIATELTFGIDKFLSTDAKVHRDFMFELFKPELKKLGVIFDKKHPDYETSILGQLDALTYERDKLRNECTHRGAFMTDFNRDGYELKDLDIMEELPIQPLEQKKNELLIAKGQADGNSKADYEKTRADIIARGQAITEEIRLKSDELKAIYHTAKTEFDKNLLQKNEDKKNLDGITSVIEKCKFLTPDEIEVLGSDLTAKFLNFYANLETIQEPKMPICPEITGGILKYDDTIVYEPCFIPLIEKSKSIRNEYNNLPLPTSDTSAFDAQIEDVEKEIRRAKANNDIISRYKLNREWVEADAKVTAKRKELAKLYAQINTGVEGLRMKPFFDNEGKMVIKTVYTGNYNPDFFKNDGTDERLLVSYSSTQRPIIGVLLQVARLKLKSKALNYIFLDDVPMDLKSREIITKIAEENNLNIITSITGDFDKDKLTENELLIEGGEVFFN